MAVNQSIIDEYKDEIQNDTIFHYSNGELVGGREFEAQQKEQREESYQENLDAVHGLDARVGALEFVGDFSDPDVEVTSSRGRREHSIISGVSELGSAEKFHVHEKTRNPTSIRVTGWIREGQLPVVDELITHHLIGMRTGRWTGMAVITSIDVDYSRTYHEEHGPIFETTIELIGVERGTLPDEWDEDPYPGADWGYVNGEPKEGMGTAYRIKQQQQEQQRIDNLFSTMDVSCVVGDLAFISEFEDPNISITHERDTVEHDVAPGNTVYRDNGTDQVVQVLGRNASTITVDGYIRGSQLETADRLTEFDETVLISGRWSGTVVPVDVNIPYSRQTHNKHGSVFEVSIELLGIVKGEIPSDIPDPTIF